MEVPGKIGVLATSLLIAGPAGGCSQRAGRSSAGTALAAERYMCIKREREREREIYIDAYTVMYVYVLF